MADLECSLIELFGWSLHDLDESDMTSVLTFLLHYPRWKSKRFRGNTPVRELYADQVEWL